MFRRKPTPNRDQLLSLIPTRALSPTLTPTANGGARLSIPLAKTQPTFLARLLRLPQDATKTFELDAIGLFVWNHLDGQTSIESLIHHVAAHLKITPREADLATTAFLQMLLRKGLIKLTNQPRTDTD